MFCTNCGIQLENDVTFCAKCGKKIGQDHISEDIQSGKVKKQRPPNYIYPWLLLGIFLLFILICALKQPLRQSQNIPLARSAPSEQINFENMRSSFFHKYINSINEIQQSAIFNDANNATREFCEAIDYHAVGWAMRITQIGTDHGGGHAYLTVSSDLSGNEIEYKTWNNELSDVIDNTSISKGTALYRNIGQFSEGDLIYVTFNFIEDLETGAREASLTELGSMRKPEFIVKFIEIHRRN